MTDGRRAPRRMPTRWRGGEGFTLIELLVAAGVFVVAAGVAIPVLSRALEQYRVGMAVRDVERELQSARSNAVTANRPIRVRVNCPVLGQFRRVEVLGQSWQFDANDSPVTRCTESSYPYPPADTDPSTRPNHDGPLRRLAIGVAFGSPVSFEFWPDGTARSSAGNGSGSWAPIPSAGVTLTLTKGSVTRSIAVNGMGRVTVIRQ